MSLARCAAGVAAFAISCSAESELIRMQLPPSDTAQSFVLMVGERTLHAGSIDAVVRLEGLDSQELRLAYYARTLEELGLAAGGLAPASCRDCALLQPSASFAAHDANDELASAPLDDRFYSLLIPDGTPRCECPSFESEVLTLPGPGGAMAAAVRESDRSVLLVYLDGTLIRVHDDSGSELLCSALPGLLDAAYDGGRLWVTNGGEVRAIDVDSPPGAPCTVTSSAAAPSTVPIWAIGADARDLVAMTRSGDFARLRGGQWAELGRIPPTRTDPDAFAKVVAPDVYVGAMNRADVIWYEGGAGATEAVQPETELEALTIRNGETVAATKLGIAVRTPAKWNPVEVQGWTGTSALVPFRDGFLVTLDAGPFAYLNAHWDLCEPYAGFSSERVHHAASLGDDAIVLADAFRWDEVHPLVGLARAVEICP